MLYISLLEERKIMKNLKKILAVVLALSMLFALGACGRPADSGKTGQTGDEKIVIKIGHTDTSTRSTHLQMEEFGKKLSEATNGKAVVEVFSDGQLGDDPDLAAGVKLGTVTMYFGLASVVSSIVGPEASCVDLPYLYSTYEDWYKGTYENGGLELFNEMLEGSGYYCLGMIYNGMRCVASSAKIYHSPADLKGQKVRIAQNELNIELWRDMGANPTPMAWGEAITALSQGTVEGFDHALGVFNDFNIYQIAPYITVTNHCSSPYPLVCSSEWLESLPEDVREAVKTLALEACKQQCAIERENEFGYLDNFEAGGATCYTLTPEEIEVFKESVKPCYDMWREKCGDEIVDKWLATVPE